MFQTVSFVKTGTFYLVFTMVFLQEERCPSLKIDGWLHLVMPACSFSYSGS